MNKDYSEIQNIIWNLANRLRTVIYGMDIQYSALRLLFLKYTVDNYVGAEDKESMKIYAEAQKLFAKRDVEAKVDAILPVLHMLDEHFNLNGILTNSDTVRCFSRELFGEEWSKQKTNATSEQFASVLEYLGTIDLEDDDAHSVGKQIVDVIFKDITDESIKSSFSGEYASGKGLSYIAKLLLNVSENDVFCDFCSGIGFSSIEITKGTTPRIINYDSNPNVTALSVMAYIMYGHEKFTVRCQDILGCVDTADVTELFEDTNKFFVDPPLGYRVRQNADGNTIEAPNCAIELIRRHMQDKEGIAVVAVNGAILFSGRGKAMEIKKKLIEGGMVREVISLPSLWRGTTVGTNLIVITSERNKEVFFVDATPGKEKMPYFGSNFELEQCAKKLVDFVTERNEVSGISKRVSIEEIVKNDYNLSPSNYMVWEKTVKTRPLSEVEAELAELYKLL